MHLTNFVKKIYIYIKADVKIIFYYNILVNLLNIGFYKQNFYNWKKREIKQKLKT